MSDISQIIRIPVSEELYEFSKDFIEANNIANRGVFDGSKRNQLVGIVGQICFYHYVFGKYPLFDGGIDLNFREHTIDVKTMERKVFVRDGFVNNFLRLQESFDCDVLMFLSYNIKSGLFGVIEICGWIYKSELNQKATLYPKGAERKRTDGTTLIIQEDLYEIPIEALYPFRPL